MSFAAPAHADEWDFVLINATPKAIASVEVAPSGTADWQPNRLDPELKQLSGTKPGARVTVHFERSTACKYDVRAAFADGSSATWQGINICDNSYVTVRLDEAGTPRFQAN